MEELIIFGASGHGKVIYDIAKVLGKKVVAFVDDDENKTEFLGLPVKRESDLPNLPQKGIIAIGDNFVRKTVAHKISTQHSSFKFINLIHPNASIGSNVSIGNGSVVMAGVSINIDSKIGDHCIVNTGSNIDHDTVVGNYSSIAPGATLGGNVTIGSNTAVSLLSGIIQGRSIGDNCLIAAGAIVINDIENNSIVKGVPGKITGTRSEDQKYLG